MAIIVIKDFTERVIGSTSGSYYNVWELVQQICCDEYRCHPDDVTEIENAEGEEIICISGEPKARLLYVDRGLL